MSLYLKAVVISLLILLFVLQIYFFSKYRMLKKQQKALALSNLTLRTDLDVARALINPHFIFNSLSALQNFILSQDHEQANDYMVKFSKLLRKMLESNASNMTTIEQEVMLLESYLSFREVGFQGHLSYSVKVDPSIVATQTYIPVMLVEPFIENTLWHGLPVENTVHITFTPWQQNYILCVIDNNNGANNKSGKANDKSAAGFAKQRLDLLNKIYHLNCTLTIEEKPSGNGTAIKILLPVLKS